MPSTGTLGDTLSSGPKNLKIKHQAFPHDGSTGLKQPTPASLPLQTTIMGLELRVQLDVADKSENFLVDIYSVLTSCSRAFSLQNLYHSGCYRKNNYKKDSPEHFFVAAMDKYFPAGSQRGESHPWQRS